MRRVERGINKVPSNWHRSNWWDDSRHKAIKLKDRAEWWETLARRVK